MATIEPRLIHLLNDTNVTHSPSRDLPPIHSFSFRDGGHPVSLPPLDLDVGASQRNDKASSQVHTPLKQLPPFFELGNEDVSPGLVPSQEAGDQGTPKTKRSGHSLRMLLDHAENGDSSAPLHRILVDTEESLDEGAPKKRHRALTGKDELMQLPQPLKRQKSTQEVKIAPINSDLSNQPRPMPPIISGLHQPPPSAAAHLLPPISSAGFGGGDNATPIGPLHGFDSATHDGPGPPAPAESDKNASGKVKRRAAKPRRKWSEEETNHLLLGVSKHGVGKWTTILEDPNYKFNERTAGDLKDRFRTCCPNELRTKRGNKESHLPIEPDLEPPLRTKTSLQLENILVDADDPDSAKANPGAQQESDAAPKQKKSRAHRKKLEDLEELGIRGPFKTSHRRVRKPFSEQDDKDILDGLEHYGPAWTKIQRDPRFGLSGRQPTDLRDRVRNKYPETYARIEKGSFHPKEPARNTGPLEPSVNTSIKNPLPSSSGSLERPLNHASSREKWTVLSGSLDLFDVSNAHGFASFGSAGEMDISRLLLDDAHGPEDR
ncbi:uncharacterized protein E0L32_005665 [Thyridium curvatum]|uniref:MYB transcription factor n=1 Tax=Thyridium curvatum TaxID=1093900 RepID=A0A507AT26_9PEZI|nr:uncharacterized protein E0L32_005665 [Thyridium curvatum]TPX13965.1 hypothetical protein E0L32_005665 [Thyridium curvatum]